MKLAHHSQHLKRKRRGRKRRKRLRRRSKRLGKVSLDYFYFTTFLSFCLQPVAAAAVSDGKKDDQPVPDEDPQGTKLLKTETPLDDALKLWRPLEKLGNRRIETWTAGYKIFIRKGGYSHLREDCADHYQA